MLDLSTSAFQVFAPLPTGKIPNVVVDSLGSVGKDDVIKRFIDPSFFSDLGVVLDTPLSNIFFSGDGINISGKVTNGQKNVLFYLKNKTTGNTIDLL